MRSYQLHAGDPLFGEAQRLLKDMGKTSVPTYRISIDDAQNLLDAAVTPEEAAAFFTSLPWDQFKFPEHGGAIHVLAPWGNFGKWMEELGYAIPKGRLQTYPSYRMQQGDPVWEALLSAAEGAGLLGRIRERDPEWALLTPQEITDLPADTAGQRHWNGYAVLDIGPLETRYIDADERPWDHSHDGNGWQENVHRVRLGGRLSNEAAEAPSPPNLP